MNQIWIKDEKGELQFNLDDYYMSGGNACPRQLDTGTYICEDCGQPFNPYWSYKEYIKDYPNEASTEKKELFKERICSDCTDWEMRQGEACRRRIERKEQRNNAGRPPDGHKSHPLDMLFLSGFLAKGEIEMKDTFRLVFFDDYVCSAMERGYRIEDLPYKYNVSGFETTSLPAAVLHQKNELEGLEYYRRIENDKKSIF